MANKSCSKRCLECPFWRDNARKLNDWHLEHICYGMTPDGKNRLVQSLGETANEQ